MTRSRSGVAHIYYAIGAAPATPTTASAEYDPAHKPALDDGERISYFAVDALGNAETPHTSGAAHVDTTAPGAPGGRGTTVDGTSARIEFGGDEGTTFSCSVDGGAWTVCTSPLSLTGLAPGAHTVLVKQSDDAGNASDALSVTFTVAAPPAPPVAPVTPTPAAPVVKAADAQLALSRAAIGLLVSCPTGGCRATASGTVTIGHHTLGKLTGPKKAVAITSGAGGKVTLHTTAALRKAVRAQLARNRKAYAVLHITVKVISADGKLTTHRSKIKIRRLSK